MMKISYFLIIILMGGSLLEMGEAQAQAQADDGVRSSGGGSLGIGMLEEFSSLRNPFRIPQVVAMGKPSGGPLEDFDLSQFQLLAVITGKSRTRAMVKLPNGKTFYLKLGDIVGKQKGVVRAILPERVLVIEKERNPLGVLNEVLREVTLEGSEALSDEELKKLYSKI